MHDYKTNLTLRRLRQLWTQRKYFCPTPEPPRTPWGFPDHTVTTSRLLRYSLQNLEWENVNISSSVSFQQFFCYQFHFSVPATDHKPIAYCKCWFFNHSQDVVEGVKRSALLINFHHQSVSGFPTGSLEPQRSFQAKVKYFEFCLKWRLPKLNVETQRGGPEMICPKLTWQVDEQFGWKCDHPIHNFNQASFLRGDGGQIALYMNMGVNIWEVYGG